MTAYLQKAMPLSIFLLTGRGLRDEVTKYAETFLHSSFEFTGLAFFLVT